MLALPITIIGSNFANEYEGSNLKTKPKAPEGMSNLERRLSGFATSRRSQRQSPSPANAEKQASTLAIKFEAEIKTSKRKSQRIVPTTDVLTEETVSLGQADDGSLIVKAQSLKARIEVINLSPSHVS